MKLNYKQTMLIGLGFFTVSIVWGIYNIAMPIYLDDLGLSGLAVGAVMTIDNIFAVIFLPIFGALSDRTNTRYGRRMPYLLSGYTTVGFSLYPYTSAEDEPSAHDDNSHSDELFHEHLQSTYSCTHAGFHAKTAPQQGQWGY